MDMGGEAVPGAQDAVICGGSAAVEATDGYVKRSMGASCGVRQEAAFCAGGDLARAYCRHCKARERRLTLRLGRRMLLRSPQDKKHNLRNASRSHHRPRRWPIRVIQ